VTLMLASYAVSDAPCRDVMRDLLDSDDRFTISATAAEEAAALPTFGALPVRAGTDDDAERAAKKEQRKALKAARKAEQARAREAVAAGDAKRREALHSSKKKHRPNHG
jgi:hypothetical protein